MLAAPLWIFAKAANFLLGFGQPYAPNYSYATSGILVPPTYVPVFFSQTVFVPSYVTPAYYPPGFVGVRRFGPGAYNMGPSVAYISRVTRINQAMINQTIHNNSLHINKIHNVVPPERVMRRDAYIQRTLPPNLMHGRPLPPPHPMADLRMARANLNRPNYLPAPKGLPPIKAQIPRVQPAAFTPGQGLPGTALPAGATMALTPHMTQQIHQLPPSQQFVPGRSQPFKTAPGPALTPGQPMAGPGHPGIQTRPGLQPGAPTRPGTGPGVQAQPGGAPSGRPAAGTFMPPGATRPSAGPQPQGLRRVTPDQRRQQDLEHQRLQRGPGSGQPQPQPRDQERVRQQQQQLQQRQQQERQRQMQMQQQDHQRQQQLQQQQKMQQQRQHQQIQERQHQMQMQQQRQQQIQHQQRQQQESQRQQQLRQQQIQQQRQPQIQPQRPQPQRQPRPQTEPEKKKREQQ
jgi:hypothetical protein